jgi:hypothetical protein
MLEEVYDEIQQNSIDDLLNQSPLYKCLQMKGIDIYKEDEQG